MEEFESHSFDDFSLEIEDFEYVQIKKFDRIFNLGEGGSFSQFPRVHENVVYVGCMDKNIYALDARSGKLLWKCKTEGLIGTSSPIFYEGVVYIGCHDQNLYALEATTGKVIWKYHTSDKVIPSPSAYDGKIYFGSNDHNVYCVNAKTGKLIWKFKTYAEVVSTPTYYKGMILVGSYDRFLYCLDSETGNQIWKFETQGDIFNLSELLIHDDRVYFPSFDNYLRAVDVNSGKLIWKFLTGQYGGMQTSPILYRNVLYQTNREGVIYALTMDGKEIWRYRINHAIGSPYVLEDSIYFGSEDQNLHCLNLKGKVIWKFKTQGALWWKPNVFEKKVYFSSYDCHLYCVDAVKGNLIWKFRGQGAPSYMGGPAFQSYELKVKKSGEAKATDEDSGRKTYEVIFDEEEKTDTYKSRITYQVSTQYSAKGKYQKDSKEEEF